MGNQVLTKMDGLRHNTLVITNKNMEINPPTKIKSIQFLGSPFQGKAAQELRERIKREKESELKQNLGKFYNTKEIKRKTFLRSFWGWFFFMFILAPFTIICGVIGLLILIIPFYIVIGLPIVGIGKLFGDSYGNFLAPVCTLIVAWRFYISSKKGEKIFDWVSNTFFRFN